MFIHVIYNNGLFYRSLYFFDGLHSVELTEKQSDQMIALLMKQGGKFYKWEHLNGLTEKMVNVY